MLLLQIIIITVLTILHSRQTTPSFLWLSLALADGGIGLTVVLSVILGGNRLLSSIFLMCCCISMMSITCLSFDKMLSVSRPFTYTLSRTVTIFSYLITIWSIGTGFAVLDTVCFSYGKE